MNSEYKGNDSRVDAFLVVIESGYNFSSYVPVVREIKTLLPEELLFISQVILLGGE